jgi:hypothetical protein
MMAHVCGVEVAECRGIIPERYVFLALCKNVINFVLVSPGKHDHEGTC